MSILTERERKIMRALKAGKTIPVIAKDLKVPRSSVSRSITAIKLKMYELKDEVDFLRKIGFLRIEKDELKFLSESMNPKVLSES
jgi:DNA-binding NarL/FixJ family response regulator